MHLNNIVAFVPTYCGGHYPVKSEAYVSAARELSKSKLIAHFFCKASLAGKINHNSKQ
jgi:hypothetical protein